MANAEVLVLGIQESGSRRKGMTLNIWYVNDGSLKVEI